jgi:DNA-binding transcriptional regulator YiaG
LLYNNTLINKLLVKLKGVKVDINKIQGYVFLVSGEINLKNCQVLAEGSSLLKNSDNSGSAVDFDQARTQIKKIIDLTGSDSADNLLRCKLMTKLRLGLKLSPIEFAKQLGISPQTVYRWENFKIAQPPRPSHLHGIEQLYACKSAPSRILITGAYEREPGKTIVIVGTLEK